MEYVNSVVKNVWSNIKVIQMFALQKKNFE